MTSQLESMTQAGAILALSRALPASAREYRRALRVATHWGSFPRAYSERHYQLGQAVLQQALETLAHYRKTGRVPSAFAEAIHAIRACLDEEGLLV